MTDQGCLIIDDVDSSLAFTTPLGREVLGRPAEIVRSVVIAFARRQGWCVTLHSTYVSWVQDQPRPSGPTWLLLDPLFPRRDDDQPLHQVQLSRFADPSREIRMAPLGAIQGFLREGSDVGVIDDTAATGRTLLRLAGAIRESGAKITSVMVCASSLAARETFLSNNRGVQWSDHIPGDWAVVHLRDGCPHLPFSGRPTGQPNVVGSDQSEIEVRIPATAVTGNLWHAIWQEKENREVIWRARMEVARVLTVQLQRPALVRDLGLLGAQIPALVNRGEVLRGDARLEHVVPNT